MSALALISELMTRSRLEAAASRTGAEVQIVGSCEALLQAAQAPDVGFVILDLEHPALVPADLLPRLRAQLPAGARVIAFGPHVHAARLAAAQEAGCDQVLSRGEFHAKLDAILQAACGPRPQPDKA
jgi:DNA-binding NarL/FixJ family response regulator